jgi:hypothetical protein
LARELYREAVSEMEGTFNKCADARLMRAEAAEVLGIEP